MNSTYRERKIELWDLIESHAPELSDQIGWGSMDSLCDDILALIQEVAKSAKPERAGGDKYFDAPPPSKIEGGSKLHHPMHQPSAREGFNKGIDQYEQNIKELLGGSSE